MEEQAANVGELLLSRGAPDDIAIVDASGRHTYADLRRAVAYQTQQLLDWRLDPGERVALLGANSLFWVASYLAIMRSGLTVVPVSQPTSVVSSAEKMNP